MTIWKYISRLIHNAYKWQSAGIGQNVDINNVKARWYKFSTAQIIFIILAILVVVFHGKPFVQDRGFVGYIIAMFSIFVGLLLSLVIIMFDKYGDIDFSVSKDDIKRIAYLQKIKRFYQEFHTLTCYSILLALFNIVLLTLPYFVDFLSDDISGKQFYTYLRNTGASDLDAIYMLKCCIIFLYRGAIVYFILDFFYLLTYSLGSVYSYMNKVYSSSTIQFKDK